MRKIRFAKMVAAGNDFLVTEMKASNLKLRALAKDICDRKYGLGADGLLIVQRSKVADVKMRVFNADGSEAEMCGNGARCIAIWTKSKVKAKKSKTLKIKTKAGIVNAQVKGNSVKIKLTPPKRLKLNIPVKFGRRILHVNYIDTGVPHTVIFVEGLETIDVVNLGRFLRYHKKFSPRGTNVDFIEVLDKDLIKIRTYERGVEDETLACGTGAVAAALIMSYELGVRGYGKINVQTKSHELLRVYFNRVNNRFEDVWLEGKAKIAYKGEYYV